MKRGHLRAVPTVAGTTEDKQDQALLRRVAHGDQAAFDQLYVEYHRRLSKFLLRFTRQYPVAEEIINDTMFAVWKQAGSFKGQSKVSTWIMGIAFRQATNMLRSIERARLRDEQAAVEQARERLSSDIDQHTRTEWISSALRQLPVEQRVALELAYFSGHSCAEIAEITDCAVNTVKSRMFAGRKCLRENLPVLAGDLPDENDNE